jgi:hypothetical protein
MASQQTVDRDFHATYSGSGIHRLLAGCYGAVRLARTVPPPPPTTWQEEGTAAHAELERRLNGQWPSHFEGSRPGVDMALAYINNLPIPPHGWNMAIGEERVIFPQSIVPAMECSGTLDVMVVSGRRAWIIDYKHGAGEHVEVEENAQLMFYAWAALHSRLADFDEITLVIIQPNCSMGEPIREYRTNALELFEFSLAVQHAIEQAERLHAPLLPGDHCKFCPAAPNCDARERSAIAVMSGGAAEKVRDWQPASLPKPQDLDLGRLGEIVTKAPAIRSWLKSVEDYAEARALAGEIEVPGAKVVEAPARRKWLGAESVAAEALRDLIAGSEDIYDEALERVMPRKLIGITEAEKLVVEAATRGIEGLAEKRAAIAKAKEAFSALTVKESSGALSLVPLSDPRPPVNRAAKHFGGVQVKGIEQ